MSKSRNNRFETMEKVELITPNCKSCKYAIDNGVNGCKKECQTLEIKFAEEECTEYKGKEKSF